MTAQGEDCEHIWISNSGQGGEPIFTFDMRMGMFDFMQAKCSVCNCLDWFTKKHWNAIEETDHAN